MLEPALRHSRKATRIHIWTSTPLIQPLLHIRPISPPAETLAMLRPRPSAPGTSSPVSSSSRATTTAMDNPRAHLLERKHHDPPSPPSYNTIDGSSSPPESPIPPAEDGGMDLSNMSRKSQWIILAVASGACAAFNGVFAKLYVKACSFFLRYVCNLQQTVMNCSSQLLTAFFIHLCAIPIRAFSGSRRLRHHCVKSGLGTSPVTAG